MTDNDFIPGDSVRVHYPGTGQANWKNVKCTVLEDDGRYGHARFLIVKRLHDGHEDGIPLAGISSGAWKVMLIGGFCAECDREFRRTNEELDYLCPTCRLDN
jgi:hypothetical protein